MERRGRWQTGPRRGGSGTARHGGRGGGGGGGGLGAGDGNGVLASHRTATVRSLLLTMVLNPSGAGKVVRTVRSGVSGNPEFTEKPEHPRAAWPAGTTSILGLAR